MKKRRKDSNYSAHYEPLPLPKKLVKTKLAGAFRCRSPFKAESAYILWKLHNFSIYYSMITKMRKYTAVDLPHKSRRNTLPSNIFCGGKQCSRFNFQFKSENHWLEVSYRAPCCGCSRILAEPIHHILVLKLCVGLVRQRIRSTKILVKAFSRSNVLKDCSLNFVDWN